MSPSAWAKGTCRWCGLATLHADGTPNRRRTWHDDCLAQYMIATTSTAQREACWNRDRGLCAGCGKDASFGGWARSSGRRSPDGYPYTAIRARGDWEADHIVPLHTVDRDEPNAIRFWLLDNLQTLCRACHKAKSAREAASRGKVRRLQKIQRGERKPSTLKSRPWPPRGTRKLRSRGFAVSTA